MGKLTTYIMMMSGLMLMFYFTGLIQDCCGKDKQCGTADDDEYCTSTTPSSLLLNTLLRPQDIQKTTMFSLVISIVGGVIGAGLLLAAIFFGKVELMLKGVFILFLASIFIDFVAVFNKLRGVNPVLAILIFSPLLVLYVVTIVEWWGKHD